MSPMLGWALAAVALVVGWRTYRWPGVALALTVVVFWLLLQFNRAIRVMKNAGSSPMGHVDSAVMLNARLRAGMPMIKVVTITRSLGRRVAENAETFIWTDGGGCDVVVTFDNGRTKSWLLNRPTHLGDGGSG
jgi:hypothetical protein